MKSLFRKIALLPCRWGFHRWSHFMKSFGGLCFFMRECERCGREEVHKHRGDTWRDSSIPLNYSWEQEIFDKAQRSEE
jgi:hypothetical protein